MDKFLNKVTLLLCCLGLAGCVTQTYENDNHTPVVQNESSNNEIAMTRISLGLGYLKMGNTTQAKLNLEKAKRSAPHLVQVHTAFAHYYDTVGEPELATQAYEKALSIKGDDPDTLNNYGVFLCKQEKYELAEKQMLKAIAVPSYLLVAQSYENLALCQLDADAFDKAEHYLSKSIQHSPSNATAILHMMRLQYAKKNYVSAQQYLKRYEKATRRFLPEALALAYKIYSKQGKTKVAKNYASMLVKMFPNSFQARAFLLNDLASIEADVLAKRYAATQQTQVVTKKKKRFVKLSPKTTTANKKTTLNTASNLNTNTATSAPENTKNGNAPTQNSASKVTQQIDSNTKQASEVLTHTVAKGDTLFSISMLYNVHMKAIERWNNISRNQPIKIGDVIMVAAPKK
ncbi:type IV pilus biogenesis/stability protein PilW [Thalassotalea sediminis]|uniref:type IV pilus biogenesis/stability protein PilW n=1 Tax=Thalassotalea sediminis TaxID=1759089 RepID=UPI0025748C89|nr:type IV pilus biogenesis/stability protein PilW [Thalassotalea sediminis]